VWLKNNIVDRYLPDGSSAGEEYKIYTQERLVLDGSSAGSERRGLLYTQKLVETPKMCLLLFRQNDKIGG
jgi:hypothetical protein